MLWKYIGLFLPILALAKTFETNADFEVRIREIDDHLDQDNPYCFAACELDVCHFLSNGGCQNTKNQALVGRQAVRPWNDVYDDPFEKTNTKSLSSDNKSLEDQLYERALGRWNAGWWTQKLVADYLPEQAVIQPNKPLQEATFQGYYQGLAEPGKENAVSQFARFGDKPIQIGSNQLHGCTVMTIISQRAVWMVHFWEVYSNGYRKLDSDKKIRLTDPRFDQNFQERVIDFLVGNPVPHPTNTELTPEEIERMRPRGGWPDKGKYRPQVKSYQEPLGQGLSGDEMQFFGPDDKPKLYIMTPLSDDQRGELNESNLSDLTLKRLRYPERVKMMVQTIVQQVPALVNRNHAKLAVVGYRPLDWTIESDKVQIDQNQRGMALFQRDPDALGPGSPAWRLFYQQHVRTSLNP